MRGMMTAAAAATLMLAGCAGGRVPTGGETITYAATPCHGSCPVYTVTLGPDGQGVFVGERNVAGLGEHRFQATPDQVRAFTAALRRFRPAGERVVGHDGESCRLFATDAPGVDIRWRVAVGTPAHLVFDYGCHDAANAKAAAALRGAPALLPIADLIGRH